jgi:hypothetical protein
MADVLINQTIDGIATPACSSVVCASPLGLAVAMFEFHAAVVQVLVYCADEQVAWARDGLYG